MSKRHAADAYEAQLRQLAATGAGPTEAAQRLGLARSTVTRVAARLNISLGAPRYRDADHADVVALRELAAAGVMRSDAARRLGLPLGTVYGLAERFGITFQSRRPTTNKDIDALRNLAALGYCLSEAVERTGIGWTAANYWMKKLDIRFRSGRTRAPNGAWCRTPPHQITNPGASGGLSAGFASLPAAAPPSAAGTDPRACTPPREGSARVLFAGENTAGTSLLVDNHVLTGNEQCLGQVGQGLGNV